MGRYTAVLEFAMQKHDGQLDKAGKPYILHPIEVALSLYKESDKVVALLHDVLEDTDATIEDLKKIGVSEEEVEAIQLLTKPKKEDYIHYVKRVANNPIARHVKMADLKHNMDLSRLSEITDKDIQRVEKYKQAYQILHDADVNSILH